MRPSSRTGRRTLASVLVMAFGLTALPVHSIAQVKAREPDLKAAIIINMAMFIDWPPQSSLPADTLNVCFLGDSPVAESLGTAQGRSIRNRTVRISKVRTDGLKGCHVVYVAPSDRPQLPEITQALQNVPALVAGDSPDFFTRGTMLNLELSAGHVVFDVDLRSAQKAGLQFSSKALRLARQVVE